MMNEKNPILTACVLVVISLFTHCTQNVGGGTGTETVNTFAKLPDGSPAAGAHVKIIDTRWWLDSIESDRSPVVVEGQTDKNGFCSLPLLSREGLFNIQIDHNCCGVVHPLSGSTSLDVDTLILDKYSSLSGNITSNSTVPTYLCLAGTDYRETTGSGNEFTFDKIPAGAFALLGISDGSGEAAITSLTSVALKAGIPTINISSGETENRVLIDNFENGIGPTSLGTVVPVMGWYVLSDSLYYLWDNDLRNWKKGKTVIFARSPISYDSVVTEGNHAFSFSTQLDPETYTANALIGIHLSALNSNGIDLSDMTAISLKAKGNGVIRMRFESAGLDKVNYQLSHFTEHLILNDTMTSYHIPVDSLSITEPFVGDDRYTWSRESKKILRIEFCFSPSENIKNEELSFTLDDLYLEGITLNDILEQREK